MERNKKTKTIRCTTIIYSTRSYNFYITEQQQPWSGWSGWIGAGGFTGILTRMRTSKFDWNECSTPPNGIYRQPWERWILPGVKLPWKCILPINNCSPDLQCPATNAPSGTIPSFVATHWNPSPHRTLIEWDDKLFICVGHTENFTSISYFVAVYKMFATVIADVCCIFVWYNFARKLITLKKWPSHKYLAPVSIATSVKSIRW